jgi:hypothetical protein
VNLLVEKGQYKHRDKEEETHARQHSTFRDVHPDKEAVELFVVAGRELDVTRDNALLLELAVTGGGRAQRRQPRGRRRRRRREEEVEGREQSVECTNEGEKTGNKGGKGETSELGGVSSELRYFGDEILEDRGKVDWARGRRQ